MSKLVYCSYNLIDQDSTPDWVAKLSENPLVKREAWAIYNPIDGFSGNLEKNLSMPTALSIGYLPEEVRRNYHALKLDPMLLEPLAKVLPRLRAADESPTIDVAFKSLYVILRSDVVLVDLNQAGHGETSQEVVYAYLSGVPVVGIAHRFILSPWMINKLSAVIFPRTTDEIVQQVLAHDHKTTAMLEHYRAEQQEADRQVALAKARAERNESKRPTTGAPTFPQEQKSETGTEPEPKPPRIPSTGTPLGGKRKSPKKDKEVGDGDKSGAGKV